MSSAGLSRQKVVIDECIWELAARSDHKAQAVLLILLFIKKAKLVVDDEWMYGNKILKKLESIRHSCAGSVIHLLNLIVRSLNFVEYRSPVNAEDAPKEDKLIAGLAIMADILVTEDRKLREWFKCKAFGTKVLTIDEALSQL
jgi:hypothetical protein